MTISLDLREKLNSAFRPHAPIEDPNSFVGRQSERASVVDAIHQPGLQVVIFGERGAGKTSLANVCTSETTRIRIFCEKDATFSDICKLIALEYRKINPAKLVYNALNDTIEFEGNIIPASGINGNMLRQLLPTEVPITITLDEVDRLTDRGVVAQFAELAKNLSTYQTNITMLFVGVATTAEELLAGHASNFRNLRQVSLDRMSSPELSEIITRGETILGLTFEEAEKYRIIELSDRLPYYLHLIATNAAKLALEARSSRVTEEHLSGGIKSAANDADQTLRQTYEHAILSVKRSEIYRQILWSMSSLPGSTHSVARIAGALNSLAQTEGGRAVSVQSVGQALKKLTEPDKKGVLISKSLGFYAFANPLMKGFVRLIQEQQ